jgi:Lipase maturation factor
LLDDRALGALLPRRWGQPRPAAVPAFAGAAVPPPAVPVPAWRRVAIGAFAALAVAATTDRALGSFGPVRDLPWPLRVLHTVASPVTDLVAPLESFNSYGLFRVMTRERPELLVEGSRDGVTWQPYGFRYKPFELDRAPVFAGLYMPRLDWQLWFAALAHGLGPDSEWTLSLLRRLLQGSAPVLGLLGHDPFAGAPPLQVRIRIAQYRFSTPDQLRAGFWWHRGEIEPYSGAWTLQGGELRQVR